MSGRDFHQNLAEESMRLNMENAHLRYVGSGNGFGTHMGNAQYISTNNMYPGVPKGTGMLIFNNLPQMQPYIQQGNRAFAYQYQGGHRGDRMSNLTNIMQPIGGPFNGQEFGPSLANQRMGIGSVTPRPTPCNICGRVFAHMLSMANHRRASHGR
ncbi:hypothetical protein ONS95_002700 [Cadophora gregata]|uniref:uncharacterized protein n=1 Tax=Cadophora gregata TaxID=51156 RepID=UPI0026DDB279|nr:uncharacterized protein ONS95_002700 [Cadophora gregata]KAK0110040.1 hypothetical protein ONS95_002700 [Cadophora gregata]